MATELLNQLLNQQKEHCDNRLHLSIDWRWVCFGTHTGHSKGDNYSVVWQIETIYTLHVMEGQFSAVLAAQDDIHLALASSTTFLFVHIGDVYHKLSLQKVETLLLYVH